MPGHLATGKIFTIPVSRKFVDGAESWWFANGDSSGAMFGRGLCVETIDVRILSGGAECPSKIYGDEKIIDSDDW